MRRYLSFLTTSAVLYSFCVVATAQVSTTNIAQLERFKQQHPEARFHGKQYFDDEGFFEQVGTADMIYGTVLATGATPEQSARNFYDSIEGIYASEVGDLEMAVNAEGKSIHDVMWNPVTESPRFKTFRLQQKVGGIPVFRSGIGFLVRNEEDFPVVMSANNLKEMQGFAAPAGAGIEPEVTDVMIKNAATLMDESPSFLGGPVVRSVLKQQLKQENAPITTSDEQVVIWAGVTNVRVEPELAVVFVAQRGDRQRPDQFAKQLIVAAVDDGEILHSENQIVADVSGSVSGNVSDGPAALECEPEVPFGLPYAEVQILGGSTVFADSNGNFDIPSGASGDVTVRSPLRGEFFEVFDDTAGGSTPSIDVTVANGGMVDFLHNQNVTEFGTSNVNAYYHANIVRDFVLSFEPGFPIIGNQTAFDITSNNDFLSGISSCNATYSGDAINFWRNTGSCNNTSIPDVIYHEYGHHLVNVTNNGQGQFGEGSGDTIGVLIEDDPILALGFFEGDCNNGIGRSAENFRSYPCNGAIHDCGQLISGCVWDTLNEIRAVDPVNARDITAQLFIGMLVVRGQMQPFNSTIGPEVTLIFLELDDDDGNIGNGTPHYQQIADAFNAHNMQAPELEALGIEFPNGTPDLISPSGGTSFQVDVSAITSTPVDGTGVLHVDSGSGFQEFPMAQLSGTSYLAEFPAAECGTQVSFFVTVDAQSGATVSFPSEAPADSLTAISATGLNVAFTDSFEADLGWSVSGNANDGQWERAIPNNGDRGDPAADAEDAGQGFCFVTDNGNSGFDDNTDVDDGTTILTSPIMDASSENGEVAVLSYFRWYDNTVGNAPFADVFEVEISNDGGSTWTELETVGPNGPEVEGGWFEKQFFISDFVTPTDQMRVRFTASDLGEGSVVEAGVDAVRISMFECEDSVVLGDLNGDGVASLADIPLFVSLLSSGEYQVEADINMDGAVTLEDIPLFVDILSSGG